MRKSLVSIVTVAVFFVGGCAKKTDDTALVTNIKAQMFSDSQLKDASLQVTSSDGQVTLSGNVPSDAAHFEAFKIASQTPGVAKVNDEISVAAAPQTKPEQPPPSSAATAESAKKPPHKTSAKGQPINQAVNEPIDANNSRDQQIAPVPDQPIPTPPPAPEPTPAPAPAPVAPTPPPPPRPREVVIPANSTLTVRMIDSIDSSVNQPGEIFHASLDTPVTVENEVVVAKGADIYVRLESSASAGHLTGKSELHLDLIKMEFRGQSYPLASGTYSLSGDSRGTNTAEKVGGGAALGAIIGAIAGRGKGAAIGAGVGAAGGGVYQGLTKGKQVKIASETKLDFQLVQPVTVTVMPRSAPPQ